MAHKIQSEFTYFNPRSPRGSDSQVAAHFEVETYFNPRSPRGSDARLMRPPLWPFISIHAPREGATDWQEHLEQGQQISIHAPREGSDIIRYYWRNVNGDFNPRSPRGERHAIFLPSNSLKAFQSTLPARGATGIPFDVCRHAGDFNPRSPRGERLPGTGGAKFVSKISIHAPREGSDHLRTAVWAIF